MRETARFEKQQMAKKASNNAETKDTKPYEPTQRERKAMEAYFARQKEAPPAPRMKVSEKDGVAKIAPNHPNHAIAQVLLMEAIGTTDQGFLTGFVTQLANAGTHGREADEDGLNFMLSVVKGVEPKDQVEAMLAAQMAAVHMATMTFAHRLAHVDNIPQQDSAERAFNKLARTFASQVEALNRHRGKGQQKVTVEHVHVHEGGQAIVGHVETPGEGGHPKSKEQPHAIAYAPGIEMRSSDPERSTVPSTSNAERSLPDARRKVARRSEG
jgi:hypothetical protein